MLASNASIDKVQWEKDLDAILKLERRDGEEFHEIEEEIMAKEDAEIAKRL